MFLGHNSDSSASPAAGWYTDHCSVCISVHATLTDSPTSIGPGPGTCIIYNYIASQKIWCVIELSTKIVRRFVKEWLEKKSPPFGTISR